MNLSEFDPREISIPVPIITKSGSVALVGTYRTFEIIAFEDEVFILSLN